MTFTLGHMEDGGVDTTVFYFLQFLAHKNKMYLKLNHAAWIDEFIQLTQLYSKKVWTRQCKQRHDFNGYALISKQNYLHAF